MKTICLFLLIIISEGVFSKNYVPALTSFANETKILELKKQNAKGNYKLLIYQIISPKSKLFSVLIIRKFGVANYWIVLSDSITQQGILKNDSIFQYSNYLKAGVKKHEDRLQFVPPLVCCDLVIYEDCKVKFYFEDANIPSTYIADKNLDKYRREWIFIIKKELNELLKIIE
jgi:hypothetical protein